MAVDTSTNIVTVERLNAVLTGYNEKVKTKFGTKADKKVPSAEGNLATLTSDGNLGDSGKTISELATAAQGAKADTAIQGVKLSGASSALTPDSSKVVTIPNAIAAGTTGATNGLMTAADKQKLDGIATGAEVNQNAFSNVKVGSTTVSADSKTDTLELVAGSGVTLTPDATNDKITIAATGTTYGADRGISLVDGKFGHSNTAITAGSVGPSQATTSTSVSVPSITYDAYGHITAASDKTFTVQNASTSQKGIVQLSDAYNSTSSSTAATSKAVKDAYDDVIAKVNARAEFFESQSAWESYIASHPSGDASKVYYVKVGTGDDKYDVYVWKTESSSGSYVKVDESSISLDGYWHGTPTSSGSGNVVTAISLGNDGSVSYTKGITALTSHQTVTNKAATIGTELTTIATIGSTNITAKIGSYASSTHTHGNIGNDGTLTDTAAAAAGNDYVVIRDADNNKIQTSTIKGTDLANAVSKTHSHTSVTLSTTAQAYDGTHTIALPATDPYTSARTPTSHTHGNITNDGKIGSTADLSVVTGTSGTVTTADLTVSSPSVPSSGTTTSLSFIDTVSQASNGKISATKKNVLVDSTYSSTGTNPVNGKAIAAALGGLDAAVTSTDGTNVQVKVTETDGKITAVNITTDNTENKSNKVTSWSSTTTDAHYPSEKLVKTALDTKADKSGTVSTVAYDTTNKKLTKTVNGTTSDIVTAATIVTDGHMTFTSAAAAAVKVGRDTNGHVVLGSALTLSDVGFVEMTTAEVTEILDSLN